MNDPNRQAGPILVCCLNFSGLVNPLRSIAEELVRRGHRDVWFCSNEERAGEIKSVAGGAIQFASLGPTPESHDPLKMSQERYDALHRPSKLRSFAALMGNADFKQMDAMYRRMLEILDEVRPAVAFIDTMSLFAIDAAITRNVPYVLSHANPVSALFADGLSWSYPTPLSGLPRAMSPAQRVQNVLFRLGRGAVMSRPTSLLPALRFIRARKAMGLWNPGMSYPRYLERAAAIVGHSVFDFEYPFPRRPEKLKMFGAMVPTGRDWGDGELRDWLDRHESVVYVGFGTMMRQTSAQVRAIVAAARLIGPTHQVLWKLPKSQRHLLPSSPLPDNLRVEEWIPSQLSVLEHPHVRVFFNQAGGNGTHEGLYFGKPMLMMPFWLDCYDFAARAVDAGAALVVGQHDLDAQDIAGKLTRLLTEESFRDRAGFWSERLRAAGGTTAAADLLFELSEGATPTAAREQGQAG